MKRWLPRVRLRQSSILITLVFLVVEVTIIASLNSYWEGTLEPRLRQAAETHSQVLANSQANLLSDVIVYSEQQDTKAQLVQTVQEILLITDPSIGEPFIQGVSLFLDYEAVAAPEGSLDLAEGNLSCDECFLADLPLVSQHQEILGVASFVVSDAYYRFLSTDMKSKLYSQTAIALGLLVLVWLATLVLFERLHKAKKLIEASDKAKTRFMANVSHELRTPLNAILGYTQLYKKDRELMKQYRQGIETIDRSADHLLLMINDILDFSKVESESIQLYPREVQFRPFLDTLCEMAEIRARLKDIDFIKDFSDDLPTTVLADDKRMRQVLLNLLNNAIKFTSKGSVTLRISVIKNERKGHRVLSDLLFEVIDTGPGIPSDKLQDIFIPFHQLDNGKLSSEGAGLGLAISQNLLKLVSSEIRVDSVLGEGSRFYFEVRMHSVVHSTVSEDRDYDAIVGYKGARKTILSIDDNALNRDVLRQRLEQLGFIVEEASNGADGLTMLSKVQPDLVMLDLLMPDLDGFAVIERIREDHSADELPVVALTAAIEPETIDKVSSCGFNDLVPKPVSDRVLIDKLQDQLKLEWLLHGNSPEGDLSVEHPLVLPESDKLASLVEAAKKHNILTLKDVLSELELQGDYQVFVEKVGGFVATYQFRKLVDYLESLE